MLLASSCDRNKPIVLPPPEVQVVSVIQQDVPVYQEWLGTLQGYVTADVRAQVTGYLLTQNYKEGTLVKNNDLLFQIDPRMFQATLDDEKAQLARAQAQQGRTDLDVKRDTPLAKQGAISQQELDNATQDNLAAVAQVQAAQAQVEKAALDLSFTKIIAPVDGIAGLANVHIGDLITAGGTVLTSISAVDPIKVLFTISEQDYLRFVQTIPDRDKRGELASRVQLELIFPSGQTYSQKGKFYALQRQVDSKTGTIQVTGVFPNPGDLLRPGQFVRVRAEMETRKGALLVPQRAVSQLQTMYQVAVVSAQDRVDIRTVQVGERFGTQWVITDGLKSGERVVVEGIQKVRQGMEVKVSEFAPPASATTEKSNL